jgi:hypothetical protein
VIAPALRLRPLTLPDLLDEAFRIYRQRFVLLAAASLATYIPTLALAILSGSAATFAGIYSLAATGNVQSNLASPDYGPYLALLVYPVQIAVTPLHYAALFVTSVWAVLGYTPTARTLLRTLARTYFPSVVLALLLGAVAILSVTCVPLGIWLLVKLSATYSAYFAEGTGFGSALQRSWRLTENSFWRTLGLLAVLLVLFYALTYALMPLLALLALLPNLPILARGVIFAASLGLPQAFVEPLIALAVTLVYFDLRVRKEAFDLELMAYRVAQPAT